MLCLTLSHFLDIIEHNILYMDTDSFEVHILLEADVSVVIFSDLRQEN